MYPLANNLVVLLYLQVCRIQDDSIAEGRVEGRTDFMQRASYYIALRRKRIGWKSTAMIERGGFMPARRCRTRGESSLDSTRSSRRIHRQFEQGEVIQTRHRRRIGDPSLASIGRLGRADSCGQTPMIGQAWPSHAV